GISSTKWRLSWRLPTWQLRIRHRLAPWPQPDHRAGLPVASWQQHVPLLHYVAQHRYAGPARHSHRGKSTPHSRHYSAISSTQSLVVRLETIVRLEFDQG